MQVDAIPYAHSLYEAGNLPEAESMCRQILAVLPDQPETLHLSALIAKHLRHADEEALALARRAIELKPQFPEAHNTLAGFLKDLGKIDEAIASYREAIRLNPDFAEAYSNLANLFTDFGRTQEGIDLYRKAIELKPLLASAYNGLGTALVILGKMDEAVAEYRRAIELKPDFAWAHCNLSNALAERGEIDDAMPGYERALELAPNDRAIFDNVLLYSHYDPRMTQAQLLAAHEQWAVRHADPLKPLTRPHSNTPDPERPLRIGYVSGDFRRHSLAFFVLQLFAHHDRRNFEVYGYSNARGADDATLRIRAAMDKWQEITYLDDAVAADLIRRDGIDILIDLAGHTAANRLGIFAHKPAPVQVTYQGYPNTTGMETMDYRITDALADPVQIDSPRSCVEELWRLPVCNWCYQPLENVPVRPRIGQQFVFGCFNNLAKVNREVIAVWAEVLRLAPDARLLLKSRGITEATVAARLRNEFQRRGVSGDRLDLLETTATTQAHLETYGRVDLSLDTFPYNGTTTTCESLWMGVPVVALVGDTHVSRVSLSLLSAMKLPDLIASSQAEYIQIAAGLARDHGRLARLKTGLRDRMLRSPLMDGKQFAADMEAAYRAMWRRWCSRA
jgi:protein O-GlcNAc transferase